MKRKTTKKILSTTALCALFLFLSSAIGSDAHAGPWDMTGFKHGTVAARGVVKDSNKSSIWVEYDEKGEEVTEIGSHPDAKVMSADAFEALYGTPLSDSAKSVLVGSDGKKIKVSDYNIGYRVAFYTSNDSERNELGKKCLAKFNRNDDKLCAPIDGAVITYYTGDKAPSEKGGRYFLSYFKPPCPGFSYLFDSNVNAELHFTSFNPKKGSYLDQTYFETRFSYEFCSGYSALFLYGPTLTSLMVGTVIAGIEATTPYDMSPTNFEIEAAMVTGEASIKNEKRPEISIDPATSGGIPLGATEYSYDSSQKGICDQGLLKSISEEDLDNTDIYLFRVSNDQLIASREGLRPNESSPWYGAGVNTEEEEGNLVYYHVLIRGPASDYSYIKIPLERWQAKTNVPDELRGKEVDFVRLGEQIKVVMVNRATGYIGTSIGKYGEKVASGDIGVEPPQIKMRPPNLKIKAERKYVVENGATSGEERQYVIGFEGSGLTSDEYIIISTEWYDHDSSPLPHNLPGYTGRLAKVILPNVLGQATDQVSNFMIKPGSNMVFVKLPWPDIDTSHFYLHVSGEPSNGNPNFSIIGAGEGALQYRPKHYAPIKVPIWDNEKKDYQWIYRPEMQFSLFDLKKMDYIEKKDGETVLHDMLKPDADIIPVSDNIMDFVYTLLQDELPVLEPFGPARELVFALGDKEEDVILGGAGMEFNLENITFTDVIALKLIQNSDKQNVLWEYALAMVGIDTDSNNDGIIDDKDDPIEEDEPGKIICYNGDDDNKSEISDREESGVSDEDDLAIVKLEHEVSVQSDPSKEYSIILEASDGGDCIKVYESPTKESGTEITLPKTYIVGTDTVPSKIYVEGYEPGEVMLDLVLKDDGGKEIVRDKIKVTIIKVEVNRIAFNYDFGNAGSDGLNIRENFTTEINIPEYVKGGQNKPSAYIRNKSVKILVRLVTDPSITSLNIKGVSDDTNGSLGDAIEKTVTFSGGISQELTDDLSTTGIDEGEYVEFTISGNTPNKVFKSEEAWKWIVTGMNGTVIPDIEVERTSGHKVYVILDSPKSPWNQTPGDTTNPWVNALEFAVVTCNAGGNATEDNAMSAITTHLYTIPYDGAGHCVTPEENFSYTIYMTTMLANCLDSALGLDATGSLLGMDMVATRRTEFFSFNFHCFVKKGSYVYDSTSAMSTVVIKWDYTTYIAAGSPGAGSVESSVTYPIE